MAIYLPSVAEESDVLLDDLTPKEIVSKLYTVIKKSLQTPDVREYYASVGFAPVGQRIPEPARDAVMSIFEELVHKLLQHEVEHFKGWLYTLAKNHCLMQLRNQRHGISVDLVAEPVSESSDPDPLKNETLLNDLAEALQHLNPEQKSCIRMFYLEKKSYQAIASETGFSHLQVKSYIQNGKRNLRLLLEKKLDNLEE